MVNTFFDEQLKVGLMYDISKHLQNSSLVNWKSKLGGNLNPFKNLSHRVLKKKLRISIS